MPIDRPAIICEAPRAIDGDTIACANLPANIRLLGIDAPELPGHCRRGRVCTPGNAVASTRSLAALLARGPAFVRADGHDRYQRTLARVSVVTASARIDASCHQIATGSAVRRYSRIRCRVSIPGPDTVRTTDSKNPAHGCSGQQI
jgi:micrococcal nuclease